ncbi:hypothetical protein [Sphingobium sp.]|uniref:hypothetical protein n=1 Tax=Sphingobium sp. TaxID=1912891 RepID=UPI002631055D|nr:hypothetical protein [Sphingobium sp.]
MNPNIAMSLDRADEIFNDLKREYDASLRSKSVSLRAVHYTHEVAERLRSVLDRLARAYWETHVKGDLSDEDCKRAHVYFPVVSDEHSFSSTMGRWRWKAVAAQHASIEAYLRSLQPYTNQANRWLDIINTLAFQSKHIDLVPQKRSESRRINVSNGGTSVSWDPSAVTFGGGVGTVFVAGAPIDPRTQRIIPTTGVSETMEIWVNFIIDGHGVNALGFCRDACKSVRDIANHFFTAYVI